MSLKDILPKRKTGRGRRPSKKAESVGVSTSAIAGRAVVAVIVLAILGIVPAFVNMAIGYVPLLAYVFIMAACFAYPRIIGRNLEFGLLVDCSTCLRNSDAHLLLRFCNPLPLLIPRVDVAFSIIDVLGQKDASGSFSFALDGKKTRDFKLGARFAHIGTVRVGVEKLVIHDPLGIFFTTIDGQDLEEVEVLPRTYDVNESFSRSLQLQQSTDAPIPFNKDGMDYTGVREYRFGDPLKSIHWKLSSHTGDLFTRLFDAVGEPSVEILCDDSFGSYGDQDLLDLYDAELETALSLHDFCDAGNLRSVIVFSDRNDRMNTVSGSSKTVSRILLKDFPTPTSSRPSSLSSLVRKRTENARGEGNLVVCTAMVSDDLAAALTKASKDCRGVTLLYLIPSGLDSKERRSLMQPLHRFSSTNVRCFCISSAEEMEGVSFD